MEKIDRKKAIADWKGRRPKTGVAAIVCEPTGEKFFEATTDLNRGFNVHVFQLQAHMHKNRRLQELWDEHGADAFSYVTVAELEYQNSDEIERTELAELLELCLAEDPEATRL